MQDRDVNLSFLEVEDKRDIQIEVGAYLRGELETLLVIFTDQLQGSGKWPSWIWSLRSAVGPKDGPADFRW